MQRRAGKRGCMVAKNSLDPPACLWRIKAAVKIKASGRRADGTQAAREVAASSFR